MIYQTERVCHYSYFDKNLFVDVRCLFIENSLIIVSRPLKTYIYIYIYLDYFKSDEWTQSSNSIISILYFSIIFI